MANVLKEVPEDRSESGLPGLDDVKSAAARLADRAVRTPLLTCEALDRRTGAQVFIKPEVLQRTGSFKFRGAFNRLSRLTAGERKTGVVAFSSGNHAQGVAAAAAELGIPAVIVMPRDAPKIKIDNTRRLGAEVVLYDRMRESREEIATRIAAERGAVVVPSFNDPHIISGQGTVGLEIKEDLETRDKKLDLALAPVGGGGLISGSSLALKAHNPEVRIYGVEPEAYDDLARSLAAREIVEIEPREDSICDALLSPSVGPLTFAIMERNLAGALQVSDDDARRAVAFAYRHLKLVVEPGGAVALAAVLEGKLDLAGKTVALVLSGGNVDPALFADIITAYPDP